MNNKQYKSGTKLTVAKKKKKGIERTSGMTMKELLRRIQ